MVTEESATSTGMAAGDKISLNTGHSGLVKYDTRSQEAYLIVKERLKRLVSESMRGSTVDNT